MVLYLLTQVLYSGVKCCLRGRTAGLVGIWGCEERGPKLLSLELISIPFKNCVFYKWFCNHTDNMLLLIVICRYSNVHCDSTCFNWLPF